MSHQKRYQTLFILTFLILMILPIFGFISGIGETDIDSFVKREKRLQASYPPLPKKVAELEAFPSSFESAFNDHLPFRDLLIESYGNLTFRVLRVSPSGKLLLGKKGRCFLATHASKAHLDSKNSLIFKSIMLDKRGIDREERRLRKIEIFLNKLEVPVVLVALPTSPLFEFHNLPGYVQRQVDRSFLEVPASQRVVNRMPKRFTEKYLIFPYQRAIEANKAYPLFPEKNFHWKTSRFTKLVASSIVERFGISPYEKPGFDDFEKKDTLSDLSSFAGIRLINRDDLAYKAGFWRSHGIQDVDLPSTYKTCPSVSGSRLTTNPSKEEKLLLVGDSFRRSLVLDLARHFGEVVSVSFSGIERDPNAEDWLSCVFNDIRPDRIVFLHHNKFYVGNKFVEKYENVIENSKGATGR